MTLIGRMMKKLTTALIAVAMMLTFTRSVCAEDDWSPNLLVNPDAETKIDGEWKTWTGGLGIYDDYGGVFPHRGNYFFHTYGITKITQNIDVSDYASVIDSGNANIEVGAWFRKYSSDAECSFRFQYYDEDSSYLDEESESINCELDKWTERQVIKTIPVRTRIIMFEIRVVADRNQLLLFDDAYFHISGSGTGVDIGDGFPSTDSTAILSFNNLKPLYNVGEKVVIDLVEKLEVNRLNRVDLWVVIKMPSGYLLYMTELAFDPFSLNPQPFRSSLDNTQTTHRVLEFEVLSGLGGDYNFYAAYVDEGKNPMTDSFLVLRSNVAKVKVVLSNE
jgi:hypothetical protein